MRDIRRKDIYKKYIPKNDIYIRECETEVIPQGKARKLFLPKIVSMKSAILLSIVFFWFLILSPSFQKLFPQTGYSENSLDLRAFSKSEIASALDQNNYQNGSSIGQLASSFSSSVLNEKVDSPGDISQIKIAMAERSDFDDGKNLNVPDYVFEDNYQLRSIEELKDYIAANRHLPGVTSRDEIKNFGINFGSMMMAILEKTEENTLYIIDNSDDIKKNKTAIENLFGKNLTLEEKVDYVIKNVSNQDKRINDISSDVSSDISSLEDRQIESESNMENIEEQIDLIREQNQAVIDFALALDTKNLVFKDSNGNINLADGKITAEDIEVLGVMKVKDAEIDTLKMTNNKTSGKGVILAGDAEVIIETIEASKESKIYITLTSSSGGKVLYASSEDVLDGKSFKVKFDGDPLTTDIYFNWLIIR